MKLVQDLSDRFTHPVVGDRLNISAFGIGNFLQEGGDVAFEVDGEFKLGIWVEFAVVLGKSRRILS
jgi:hypothetical protein